MGSGAGKFILPLVSLAAAPLTGGTSLVGVGGTGAGLGTFLGLANAGIGALRGAQRDRAADAALEAEIQSARTEKLLGEIDLAEQRTDAEKRRARQLAGIANSGRAGPSAKSALAGAADRDSSATFASLAARDLALQSRARNRLAGLRRRGRQNRVDRGFGLLDQVRGQVRGQIRDQVRELGPIFDTFS